MLALLAVVLGLAASSSVVCVRDQKNPLIAVCDGGQYYVNALKGPTTEYGI